ncbi:MAG TPA: lactate utilization protein LutB domain-containing protein, partial [Planctomycetaceae bacterium]|nr:lactate utilization protein LutB domain-containing protein [Planctomycetaceae bacterium]
IDLHHQLLTWRREIAVRGLVPWSKRLALGLTSFVMQRPKLFNFAGAVARRIVPWLPRFVLYNPLNPWGRQRELPDMPSQSFREMYRKSRRPKHHAER